MQSSEDQNFLPGVVADPRSEDQKKSDFPSVEIYGIPSVQWGVKDPADWSTYSIRNQKQRSSCIGEGIAKAFEVEYGEPYSSIPIYSHRKNQGPGMWLQDGGDIAIKVGTVPERIYPSANITEAQCNTPTDMSQFNPADIKKAKAYVFAAPKDIDQIAQALDAGHPVILTFGSNYQEWIEIPKFSGTAEQWGHCVCDPKDRTLWTDKDYQNMKAIVIDESWGVGINADHVLPVDGKRLITEEFLVKRCTGAMFLVFDKPAPAPVKPQHNFARQISFGMTNDPDVKALQQCLAYDGEFVNDPKYFTGNYYQMTAKAVTAFQLKYQIATPAEIAVIAGKNVGPKTRAKLNSLFN